MTENAKRRIVFVSHTGQISGAEKVLLNILRGLDRERYRPFLICPEEGSLKAAVEAEGVTCIAAPLLRARITLHPGRLLNYAASVIQCVLRVRKILQNLDPDLIHANSPRAGIVATLATAGTSRTVIWHVHDILPRHPVSIAVRLVGYLSRRTRIIAVSDATANAFCGRLRFRERMRTLYNGVDLSRFPLKEAKDTLAFKRQLGIPEDSFLVCAVGQICARKGLRGLLQAFEQGCAASPTMHLAIVGKVVFSHEETCREQLVRYVADAKIGDRVHFTGEAQDASAVLRGADLLVLNSLEEPFGLVLVEAMSSGTPVLAAKVGGIPEIVTDAVNGWLVEKGDTAGLSRKLVELSRNRHALQQAADIALRTTCQRFCLERFQQNLHGLYAEFDFRTTAHWKSSGETVFARNGSE
jgi:L-malate glycosyltransferase